MSETIQKSDPLLPIQARFEPLMVPGVWLSLAVAAWEETHELDMLRTDEFRDEALAREKSFAEKLKTEVRQKLGIEVLPPCPEGDLMVLLWDSMQLARMADGTLSDVFIEIERARNALITARKR